ISRAFFCAARCSGFIRQARMPSSCSNSTIVTRSPSSAKKPLCEMYPGMVLASSIMRSTRATYSSRTFGIRRERKTVTIMASLLTSYPDLVVACRLVRILNGHHRFWRSLFRAGFDGLHVFIRQSEMMADLVHQDVGNDFTQRVVVFGPIVED